MRNRLFLVALSLCLSAGSSAQDATMTPAHQGKVTVVVTHEVKDYAACRKIYDADEPNRKMAGFKVSGVYVDANNPNMVTIIGESPSAEAANAFATSPRLKEAMEHAGVIGKPDVKILTVSPK